MEKIYCKKMEIPNVAVDRFGRWFDADHNADYVLDVEPDAALAALTRLVARTGPRDWLGRWQSAELAAQTAIDTTLAV